MHALSHSMCCSRLIRALGRGRRRSHKARSHSFTQHSDPACSNTDHTYTVVGPQGDSVIHRQCKQIQWHDRPRHRRIDHPDGGARAADWWSNMRKSRWHALQLIGRTFIVRQQHRAPVAILYTVIFKVQVCSAARVFAQALTSCCDVTSHGASGQQASGASMSRRCRCERLVLL